MAAGDIIIPNGTITPEILEKIAAEVKDLIATTSKDPGQYEEVTSLAGVSSLPVFQQMGGVYKLVRVAVSVLKGVDGREIHLQVSQDKTYIQWRYTDGMWNNLLAIADLKGDSGETPIFRTGSTGIQWKYQSEPDTAYRVLVAYDVLKLKFSDLTTEQVQSLWDAIPADLVALFQKPATDAATEIREQMSQLSEEVNQVITDTNTAKENATKAAGAAILAAENVQDGEDGKTPILESVNVQSGAAPSGSFSQNGADAAGNPKYTLNLTVPKGDDGKEPVIEIGTITTGESGTEASATLIPNGQTAEGNPKYILSLTIPRGEIGKPGEGSGNMLTDATGVLLGKQYLLQPVSNDSSEFRMIEYIAPDVPTKTSDLTNNSGFITKAVNDLTNYYLKTETYTKTEVTNLIGAITTVRIQKVDVLPEVGESNVIYFVPKSGSGDDVFDEYVYIDGKPEHIGSTQVDLAGYVQEAPADGKTYGRKDSGWSEVVVDNSIPTIPFALIYGLINAPGNFTHEVLNNIFSSYQYSFDRMRDAIKAGRMVGVDGTEGPTEPGGDDHDYSIMYANSSYSIEADKEVITIIFTMLPNEFRAEFSRTWQGIYSALANIDEAIPEASTSSSGLMSAEDKKRVDAAIVPTNVTTATSLTGLSIANYSIKVTLSSATGLSFASTPAEGWECMIDVKNTSSSTLTLPLPNASGWQCEDTSITVAAGKIASISVRYVHGTYVVIAKGF